MCSPRQLFGFFRRNFFKKSKKKLNDDYTLIARNSLYTTNDDLTSSPSQPNNNLPDPKPPPQPKDNIYTERDLTDQDIQEVISVIVKKQSSLSYLKQSKKEELSSKTKAFLESCETEGFPPLSNKLSSEPKAPVESYLSEKFPTISPQKK